eukprot:Lankesteria_metandrocarpae@DN3746_c0_g1_i1.p1
MLSSTTLPTANMFTEQVSEFYKETLVAKGTNFSCSDVCVTGFAMTPHLQAANNLLPKAVRDLSFGCSTPVPVGLQGRTVLDLGSGGGRDCYLAATQVGKEGKVIGVDITDEMLEHARSHIDEFAKTLKWTPNMEFKKGNIESLVAAGIEPNSVDVCISNCVVNLANNKSNVLRSVFECLKDGGEMYFSDIYSDRRLPLWASTDRQLVGECLGAALYYRDFENMARSVGFNGIRIIKSHPHTCTPETSVKLNNAKFYSVTYRLFKCAEVEDTAEHYGDTVTYMGSMEGAETEYVFDVNHTFGKYEPLVVDGQTAALVSKSWLASHFRTETDTLDTDNVKIHMGPAFIDVDPVKVAEALPLDSKCCSSSKPTVATQTRPSGTAPLPLRGSPCC